MKTSFDWRKIRGEEIICPNMSCSAYGTDNESTMQKTQNNNWICPICKWTISDFNLLENRKGKESIKYKKSVSKWSNISKFNKKNKNRFDIARELQENERQRNRVKMEMK